MNDAIKILEDRITALQTQYAHTPEMWLAHRLVEAQYIWYVLKHRPEVEQ